MSKKDVIIMCQFFYPEYITSALLPYQTAKALVEDGMRVDVLCGYPKEYNTKEDVPKKETIDGIHIKRVKYMQLSRGNFLSRLVNYFSFVLSMLFKIFQLKNYKVIMVYSNPPILPIIAILANKLWGTKIVFVAYDVYPEIALYTGKLRNNSIITKVMNWINQSLYSKADIIALSSEMKNFILNNRNVSEERVHIINNWATERSFNIDSKSSNDSFVITYLGNMGIPQEFETILKAMSDEKIREKNIVFNFAGHGNKINYIQEYVDKNELSNIKILGYLQEQELERVIKESDIFFLSLKNKLNGLAVPSKFYTYLLSNKPILSVINKNSDIAEETKKFNLGYSVEEGEVSDLVDKILLLKENKDHIDYSTIYEIYYSRNVQLNRYVELFHTLLEVD